MPASQPKYIGMTKPKLIGEVERLTSELAEAERKNRLMMTWITSIDQHYMAVMRNLDTINVSMVEGRADFLSFLKEVAGEDKT